MELSVQDSNGLPRSLRAGTGMPTLAVFFKSSCPTCKLVWPLVERLHREFGSRSTIIGISQEEPSLALPFHRRLGATFEVL
jgi:thiol-disulfide isomerase/thioredoxin